MTVTVDAKPARGEAKATIDLEPTLIRVEINLSFVALQTRDRRDKTGYLDTSKLAMSPLQPSARPGHSPEHAQKNPSKKLKALGGNTFTGKSHTRKN